MKRSSLLRHAGSVLILTALGLRAASLPEATIAERGPHHAVWKRITQEGSRTRTNTIHEIGTGLAYWTGERYEFSSESLDIIGNEAVGLRAPHKVILSGNALVPGAADIELPNNAGRLMSTVLGINLYDPAQNRSLLIAELRDAEGQLSGANRVVYPAAMDTIDAEVSLSFHKWGVEQFVSFRERFELPEGFNPESTFVEVWTEFFDPPPPKVTTRLVNDIEDACIDFGSMQMRPGGRAFTANVPGAEGWSGRVYKTWHRIDDRFFVVEAVRWIDIADLIGQLPHGDGQAAIQKKAAQVAGKNPRDGKLSARAFAQRAQKPMQVASANPRTPQVVIDWSIVLTPQSTLTLEPGKTWFVSSPVLATNLVIGPAVVVKYTNGACIEIWHGSVDCRTEPYAPAVFTAYTDATVGDPVTTNTTVNGFYASTALKFHDTFPTLSHIRVSYATNGVSLDQDGELRFKHAMFTHCSSAILIDWPYSMYVGVQNALFYSVSNVVKGQCHGSFEHATVDICRKLTGPNNTTLSFINCLVARLDQWGEDPPATNQVYLAADGSFFKTVGSSSHYLADGSPYRDIGVNTAIAPELRVRTTYGPVVHASPTLITNQDRVLTPVVQRDADGLPDLGWHPAVIDHVFSAAYVQDGTVHVKPGTVLAFYNSSEAYGMGFGPSGRLIADGSPTNLIRFVRYSTVQEIANTNWAGYASSLLMTTWWDAMSPPEINMRFAEFGILGEETCHIYGYQFITNMGPVVVRDSQLRGGWIESHGIPLAVTNCLLEGVMTVLYPHDERPFTNHFRNNLFRWGELLVYPLASTNEMTFQDNLFDRTVLSNSVDVANSHNGYLTNQNRLIPTNTATDVVLTTLTYHTGPLGRYYLPTNSLLVNAASVTNAAERGFYWYTSFTNQTLEATGHLNIGQLYIGLTNGLPVDTDSDGNPSYLEDANGDGDVDSGETKHNDASDLGLKVLITRPRDGSVVP